MNLSTMLGAGTVRNNFSVWKHSTYFQAETHTEAAGDLQSNTSSSAHEASISVYNALMSQRNPAGVGPSAKADCSTPLLKTNYTASCRP